MKLETQKFLRETPNGIEELKSRFAIDCKRHGEYPQLCLFKYNQIDSPFKEPIVQEARGIILDESDNWNVVAMGFKKIHNQSESLAANIDWLTAEVQEKIDGSLILLYHYDNKWHIATSGTPDASGEVNGFGKTFKELFWETVKAQKATIEFLGPSYTWIFELTTPFNRVVVDHKDCKIWLLGARDNTTLQELTPNMLGLGHKLNTPCPKSFPLHSIEDCVKAAEALNPLEHEGYVVVDANFNRVKIKSPAYVMLHHAKDSLSKKRMCEIIRKGEASEFGLALNSFPELRKIFDEIFELDANCRFTAFMAYQSIKHIENQKEFALEATKYPFASILFQMRKTGASAAQCLTSPKLSLGAYMKLIGITE
jgi:hypothetical protein